MRFRPTDSPLAPTRIGSHASTRGVLFVNRYKIVRLLPARVVSVISTIYVYNLLIIYFAALLCVALQIIIKETLLGMRRN